MPRLGLEQRQRSGILRMPGPQQLDSDRPAEDRVGAAPHLCHTADSDPVLQLVPARSHKTRIGHNSHFYPLAGLASTCFRERQALGLARLAGGIGLRQLAVAIDRLEVSYCEGWDPQARRAVGPLSSSRAAQRDRAGEQYALTLAMSGRPLAVIEVAWANVYCGVWFFDEQLRRVMQVDCRRLATDRLFIVRGRQWAYTEPDQAEFDERVTWGEFRLAFYGTRATSVHGGSATPTANLHDMVIPETNRLDPPAFGGWAPLVRAFPGHLAALGHEISAATAFQDVSDPSGQGLPEGTAPWHPPRPRQPGPLDLL